MSADPAVLAETLEDIDERLVELRAELWASESASIFAEIQDAIAESIRERRRVVAQLEEVGLGDPDPES